MRPFDNHRSKLRRGWAPFYTVMSIWSLAVVAGFGVLAVYSRTPGVESPGAGQWPAESALAWRGHATLVMFLHPRCPCSQASLEQFHRIMANAGTSFHASIVFVRPPGVPEGWERSDLWHTAEKIPGAQLHVDAGGVEARRFEVATSGATRLYGNAGNLLFRGGITGERGHAGDNPGADAVLAGLKNGRAETTNTPVFGCSLFE